VSASKAGLSFPFAQTVGVDLDERLMMESRLGYQDVVGSLMRWNIPGQKCEAVSMGRKRAKRVEEARSYGVVSAR
jgi:hypothetical protein